MLQDIASFLGLPRGYITHHSFHIGTATSAAVGGISDDQIMRMGHWIIGLQRLSENIFGVISF